MSDAVPRVAIVTGGSGGIGRAVAEQLAADGMHVTVHCSSRSEQADDVVAAITANGGTAFAADPHHPVSTAGGEEDPAAEGKRA